MLRQSPGPLDLIGAYFTLKLDFNKNKKTIEGFFFVLFFPRKC